MPLLKISHCSKIIAFISALALHLAVLEIDIPSKKPKAPSPTKIDLYKLPKPEVVENVAAPEPPPPVAKKVPKKPLRPKKTIIIPPAATEVSNEPRPIEPERVTEEAPPTFGLKAAAPEPAKSPAAVILPSGNSLATKATAKTPAGGAGSAEKSPKPRFVAAETLSALPKTRGPCTIPFPEEAERLGQEGDVVLSLDIDERGKVTRVKLLKGVSPLLDQAAIRGIEGCSFIPAQSGGENVAVVGLTYRYSFVLDL